MREFKAGSKDLLSPFSAPPVRWASGKYYNSFTYSMTSQTHGLGVLTFVPLWHPPGASISTLACYVAASVAGSTVRLGVYADTGAGVPGALMLDAGVVTGDVFGDKTLTVSLNLGDAGLVWLAAACQGSAVDLRTWIAPNGFSAPLGATTASAALDANNRVAPWPRQSGVTAGLPALAAPDGTTTNRPYVVAVGAA